MAYKFDDFKSLTKEDLELKKIKLDVNLLQKQIEDAKEGLFEKVSNYLQRKVGPLFAIAVLIWGFIGPVLNFVADAKKSQLININKSILQLLDKTDTVPKFSKLMEVSIQDPNIVAPFLLARLNESNIDTGTIRKVYRIMYSVNSNKFDRSFWDRATFFFVKDNKGVIEDELRINAENQFNRPIPAASKDQKKLFFIWETYIDIIYDLKLEKDKDFIKTLNILQQKCSANPKEYGFICVYINSH
jgi:hypothetical protein